MTLSNEWKAICTTVLTGILVYFRIIAIPIFVLLVFMILDYLTGLASAWIKCELSSRTGITGIIKKVMYLVLIAVGIGADWVINFGLSDIGIEFESGYLIGRSPHKRLGCLLDEVTMEQIIQTIYDWVWSPALVAICLLAGLYFSVGTRFVQVRRFREMARLLFSSDNSQKTGITSFQAFSMALSGRVGTGNIVGVATAIGYGGPGAIVWMWIDRTSVV